MFFEGSHIIFNLPNFYFIDDVVGFLCLHNLIKLGSILDLRRYREHANRPIWDDDQFIPEQMLKQYKEAKQRSKGVLDWLFKHFQLDLMCEDAMAEEGSPDDLVTSDRLQIMANSFFSQQCRALVLNKWEAEKRKTEGIYHFCYFFLDLQLRESTGQSRAVKTWRICQFIEDDFGKDEEFMQGWPQEHGDSIEKWIESWRKEDSRTYAWPSAPEGYYYRMNRVNTPE